MINEEYVPRQEKIHKFEKQLFVRCLHQLHDTLKRNIGACMSFQDLPAIALGIVEGTLIGVSDASVDNKRAAHAYTLETRDDFFGS